MRAMQSSGRQYGAGSPFHWFPELGYGRPPFASLVAGAGGITAGPNGVALGLFGWVDPTTLEVSNVASAGALLGFVLPTFDRWNWQRAYPQPPAGCCGVTPNFSGLNPAPPAPAAPFPLLMLRVGMPCVVAAAGVFNARFSLGGQAGNRVWADPASGLPYDSDLGGYVATPWTLMQSGGCGAALRISSFVSPFN